jgi:hypothetical protein
MSNETQQRVKHRLEGDWTLLTATDNDNCDQILKKAEYKMTCTHNNITRKCTAHVNNDDHKMIVSYYTLCL